MNIEIKGSLARLLATENLLVEHKQVQTASFNVEKRVLTLPMWSKASNTVYNLLVGHEVGHALYTPNTDLSDCGCPKSYINVTEDARIEKLMKRKYPGLSKDFFRGYEELDQDDFFSIKDEDLDLLPLVDRINLHFKIGAYSMMPFTPSETPLRDAVGAAETFEEAVAAAVAIYEYMKEEQEKEKTKISAPVNPDSTGGGDESEQQSEERPWFTDDDPMDRPAKKSDDADLDTPSYDKENHDQGEDEEDEEGFGTQANDMYGDPSIDEVRTQSSFDSKAEDLSSTYAGEITYASYPKVNHKKVVVPAHLVWEDAVSDWANQYPAVDHPTDPFTQVDSDFVEFCTKSSKDVNYLVKEFECRKSATAHARATTSRTGVLDMSKLHTYKYNEDLFKKVTRTPDGKNHGLVFLLDWSGSMCDELFDTVKQVINLAQFCKKVGIPFDVYSFVCDPGMSILNGDEPGQIGPVSSNKDGELWIDNRFKLVNLLTSTVNQKVFNQHCKYLYRVAYYYGHRRNFCFTPRPPRFMGLGGTPLNDALIVMESFLGKWKSQNNVEKCHLLILTDGESQSMATGRVSKYENDDRVYPSYHSPSVVIRRQGRYFPAITDSQSEATNQLIKNLREVYPESNILGFRICKGRALEQYMRYHLGVRYEDREKVTKQFRKRKSAVIKGTPYSELYVIAGGASEDTEMTVVENATKSQIKSAFVKSLKSKGINRIMLSSFVGQIA